MSRLAETLRAGGKTITLCHGVFDLLHPGHVRHLQAAKREGDVLVVTITADQFVNKGPGRPAFNQGLRAETLAALECVDFVSISEAPTAVEVIGKLRPDVYAKGQDYAQPEDDLTGGIDKETEAVEAVGGRLHITTDDIAFSSTHLLNTHFPVYPEEARLFLEEFRQHYQGAALIARLQGLKTLSVLVVGDAIIDQYCYVEPVGKSPKDHIITTRYLREESFAGGALATANHLAGFCGKVNLLTAVGSDSQEDFVHTHLKPSVTPYLLRYEGFTPAKRRFVDPVFLGKMFEVAWLDPPLGTEEALQAFVRDRAGEYDLVVASDFGHGLISGNTPVLLGEKSRFLAVNAQTNSANMGFNLIRKYPKANYVCLDELEARLACHDRNGPLETLMEKLMEDLDCGHIAVTLGHRGSQWQSRDGGFFRVPALSTEIVDRMGAGDAYLAVSAACIARGMSTEEAAFVGNAAGALAVRIVGNREPVEPVTLFKFIAALLK